jgi:hypothetical protein
MDWSRFGCIRFHHFWNFNRQYVYLSYSLTCCLSFLFTAWIFQVTSTLNIAAGKKAILSGGALKANIVWVVSGSVSVGAGAHLEGVILGKTSVSLLTGASLNGRILAQTSVALQKVFLILAGSAFLTCANS